MSPSPELRADRPGDRPMVTPEQLQNHADSVRALAHRLLLDEHAAEDVVQDTWVMALEHPPRRIDSSESLGGWLRTVTRSLVRRQARGHRRRERRELAGARPEAVGGPDELQSAEERAATLRHLTDAVLSLSEPYRGTLLQRYFENLPPREIAKREGVSVATVKSRLQRGLERLRSGLDEEYGEKNPGWRRELAAFVGIPLSLLPPPPGELSPGSELAESARAPAASNPGVFPMAGAGKLLFGALVALLGASAVWRVAKPDDEGQRTDRGSLDALNLASDESVPATASRADEDDSARTAVLDPKGTNALGTARATKGAGDVQLEVTVVDPYGLPVPNTTLFAAPMHLGSRAMNRVGITDQRGKFSFLWSEEQAYTDLALALRGPDGEEHSLQSLRLARGSTNAIEQVIERVPTQYFRTGNVTFGSVSFGVLRALPHPLDRAPMAVLDDEGRTHFVHAMQDTPMVTDEILPTGRVETVTLVETYRRRERTGSLDIELPKARAAAEARDMDVLFGEPVETIVDTIVETSVDVEILPEAKGQASGWVRDLDGQLRGGIPVAILTHEGALVQRQVTQRDGAFNFGQLQDREYVLRAGGGALGLAEVVFRASEARPYQWAADLIPGERLEGSLRISGQTSEKQDVTPWKGWGIRASTSTSSGTRSAWAAVAPDGSFALPGIASQASLAVLPPGRFPGIPLTIVPQAFSNTENPPIELEAGETKLSDVRVAVRDPEGRFLNDASVRLWHEDSTRGTWALLSQGDESEESYFQHGALPRGSYRVEVGAAGHVWQTMSHQWIGAGESVDLGVIVLRPTPE